MREPAQMQPVFPMGNNPLRVSERRTPVTGIADLGGMMELNEASAIIKEHIREVLKEDYKDLTADELAKRESEVFRKARNLLTRVELEIKELEVKKMEVEQHMRALRAIVAGNSLLIRIEAEGATPKK